MTLRAFVGEVKCTVQFLYVRIQRIQFLSDYPPLPMLWGPMLPRLPMKGECRALPPETGETLKIISKPCAFLPSLEECCPSPRCGLLPFPGEVASAAFRPFARLPMLLVTALKPVAFLPSLEECGPSPACGLQPFPGREASAALPPPSLLMLMTSIVKILPPAMGGETPAIFL